jgi:uncharacterized protein YndB with AHSA1/START domain
MDRIEKKILLRARPERVWRAISDSKEFGLWFGVKFDGPFVAGKALRGSIVPTTVDPEVAKLQEPHAGKTFDIDVERIEPMKLFAFRWHPFAIDAGVDYSQEQKTLVTFALEEQPGGVLLTITETGFERLPGKRRKEAFTANEGGWSHQLKLIEKYVG